LREFLVDAPGGFARGSLRGSSLSELAATEIILAFGIHIVASPPLRKHFALRG
jgi:hypothetical protein